MGSTFRKGSKETGQSSGMANQLGQFAQTPGNTGNIAYNQLAGFLQNGRLPRPLSLTGPLQDLAHQQATANQGILDTGARGGMLQSSLANNILQGQMGRQSLISNLQNQLFGQALGGTPVAMQGFGNASQILSNLGAQRIGQNQAFQGGLGQLAGAAGKAAFL